MEDIRILISGDRAVSVQMGSVINREINRRVLMLKAELEKYPIEGVTETVPAYSSLMVHYRPEVIRYRELSDEIRKRSLTMGGIAEEKKRIVEIPVCYGGEFGPDLEYCAELEHTTPEEIIRKHTQHDHYVYMLGFAPGQPYSARFEEPYGFKRRETARLSAPAGSAVVQQDLSDIIPFDQPCGWNIIGRTPCEICDYTREEPFLLRAGDWIRHRSVSPEEYREIRRQVRAKEWKPVVIE